MIRWKLTRLCDLPAGVVRCGPDVRRLEGVLIGVGILFLTRLLQRGAGRLGGRARRGHGATGGAGEVDGGDGRSEENVQCCLTAGEAQGRCAGGAGGVRYAAVPVAGGDEPPSFARSFRRVGPFPGCSFRRPWYVSRVVRSRADGAQAAWISSGRSTLGSRSPSRPPSRLGPRSSSPRRASLTPRTAMTATRPTRIPTSATAYGGPE